MRFARRSVFAGVLVLSALGGCAQFAGPRGPQGGSPSATPTPPPVPTPPPAPAPAALEVREERRLAKELLKAVEEYYRELREKNVEAASAFVEPQFRKAYQDDLWNFVTTYKVDSVQVASYQFFPQPDGLMAKVKVARTLFEKGSVAPQKSEVWMTWFQKAGGWTIRPQEQK